MKKTAYVIFIFFFLVGCATFVLEDKNRSPQFLPIKDQRILPASKVIIPFVISDEKLKDLKITAKSSDQTLIRSANIKLKGKGNKRSMEFISESNIGKANITLYAKDDKDSGSSISFQVVVSAKLKIKDDLPIHTAVQSIDIDNEYMIIGLADSVYIMKYTGSSWKKMAKLQAEQHEHFPWQVSSVSISQNYAVIGSQSYPGGSVYVFQRDGDKWLKQVKLTPDSVNENRHFGHSVSISGNNIVISALSMKQDLNGQVYIFKRKQSTWLKEAKFFHEKSIRYDWFGHSVDILDDYITIGAPGILSNSTGSVYILKNKNGLWKKEAEVKGADSRKGDSFGFSVAMSKNSIIIGAPRRDDLGADVGAAYIFRKDKGEWLQQSKLMSSDSGIGERFGNTVAIFEDIALINSPRKYLLKGAVYVFRKNQETWRQEKRIIKEDNSIIFGKSLAISPKFVVIGASLSRQEPKSLPVYTFPQGYWK